VKKPDMKLPEQLSNPTPPTSDAIALLGRLTPEGQTAAIELLMAGGFLQPHKVEQAVRIVLGLADAETLSAREIAAQPGEGVEGRSDFVKGYIRGAQDFTSEQIPDIAADAESAATYAGYEDILSQPVSDATTSLLAHQAPWDSPAVDNTLVLSALREHVRSFDSQKDFARNGVHASEQYVSDVLRGKVAVPERWAAILGYAKAWVYVGNTKAIEKVIADTSPPHVADALDGERLDWVIEHRSHYRVQGSDKNGWYVLDCSNGLQFITAKHPTPRQAIDAARAEAGGGS
jgi:hypothetical protein